MRKILITLAGVLALTASSAYAIETSFDRDSKMVTISGEAVKNESLSVVVTTDAVTNLDDVTKEILLARSINFFEVDADSEGKYTKTFKESDTDGICNIFVSGEETEDFAQIELFSKKALQSALETIETAAKEGTDSVKQALKDEALRKALGINELYNDLKDKDALVKAIAENEKFDSFSDFNKSFELIGKQNDLLKAFNEMANKAQVKDLVKELYTVYADEDSTYKKYKGISNTTTVDSAVFKAKPYATLKEVYDKLKDAVSDYDSSSDKKGGSSGGGGGGGKTGSSGGVSGITYYNPNVENTEISENTPAQSFKDVSHSFWGYEAIEYLYTNGIVNGVGDSEFAPDADVTREQFVKMLILALDIKTNGEKDTFADTDKNAWYSEYLKAANDNRIVLGREDGSFGIGEKITRQDMAVLASRAIAKDGSGISLPEFNDKNEISDYAKSGVAALCDMGIMNGMGDNLFLPMQSATRAQAAKVIYEIVRTLN